MTGTTPLWDSEQNVLEITPTMRREAGVVEVGKLIADRWRPEYGDAYKWAQQVNDSEGWTYHWEFPATFSGNRVVEGTNKRLAPSTLQRAVACALEMRAT